MTIETPPNWPLPWRIAAALALESGLGWARWAYGLTAAMPATPGPDCDVCSGWGGFRDDVSDQWYTCPRGCLSPKRRAQVPVPDPSDAEAYRADVARRGVEPGPMPALEHRPDSGLWWAVECSPHDGSIVVHVGHDYPTLWTLWGPGAGTHGDYANMQACFRRANIDVVNATLRLATAAARAMGVGT